MASEDRQIVILRRVVKSLGVVLIIGFAFVISVVIGRVGESMSQDTQPNESASLAVNFECSLFPKHAVSGFGDVLQFELDGRYFVMLVNSKHSSLQQLITLDRCDGEVVQIIDIIK